jgi:hypothetical protein
MVQCVFFSSTLEHEKNERTKNHAAIVDPRTFRIFSPRTELADGILNS